MRRDCVMDLTPREEHQKLRQLVGLKHKNLMLADFLITAAGLTLSRNADHVINYSLYFR